MKTSPYFSNLKYSSKYPMRILDVIVCYLYVPAKCEKILGALFVFTKYRPTDATQFRNFFNLKEISNLECNILATINKIPTYKLIASDLEYPNLW